MPSSYTPQQKAHISQFVGFTSAKDSVAAKHLKSHGWNVEQAIDANMYSLSKEEQWKIIQKEDRRTGRGRRKKKKNTLIEQLRDMGGFGHDPDSEEEVRKDLERMDTRRPLQYSEDSISDSEMSSEEISDWASNAFWESRRRLFNSWVFRARRPNSWIEEQHLPLLFRFALRRPLMDEMSLQVVLQTLNVKLKMSMGDVRQPNTSPIGRSRKLMFGIDVDEEKKVHPSSIYRRVLPKGATEDTDGVTEEVMRIVQQDDEDMQELLRRQLWTVYEHVQNGSVPLEKATWHYRDAFNTQDMSDETLVVCLQQFDIPTDHILTNELDARRGSAHSPSPSGVESSKKEVKNIDIPEASEETKIEELVRYVRLYRSSSLSEREVIPLIQDWLAGLPSDSRDISDILNDFDKDEKTAALLIFEDACENASEEDEAFYEEDDEDFYDEYDRRFREEQAELHPTVLVPVKVPESQGNDRRNHEAAVAQPTDGSKSPNGPMTEVIDYPDDFKENEPEQSEAMSIDQPLMSPTAAPPDTPRPKPALLPAATEESISQADEESDREPPRDRETVGRRRLLSPDEGTTTGIWGLLMPTKTARKLAHQMNLPQATINEQVRSISPRRIKRRRASYAKTIVTFPKSKRKASMTLHRDTPLKSPKRGDHSDIFAREGEDQESFVLSHFNLEAIGSEDTCNRCLRLPCECVSGSSPRSGSEPECPKCLRKPCVCGHLTDLDEAIPSTPRDGKPTFDALRANTAHKTQPKPPKQSYTLIPFLEQALGQREVLALIRNINRLYPADRAVKWLEYIIDEFSKARVAGIKVDVDGDDDREALHILDDLLESSQTLTDFKNERMYKNEGMYESGTMRMYAGEGAFTTSDEHHLNRVSEGADIDSSLLKSSSDHEHVPTPLPNPSASAAAFLETQSNVANVSAIQANNKPLARYTSPFLPISAPNSSAPHLESIGDLENAVQSSRFQANRFPDSSAASDPSGAGPDSGSAARGEPSTTGGRPSEADVSSGSSAGSPPSSSAELSEQVSEHPVDARGDTDHDTWGATLTRQSRSTLRDAGDSEVGKRPPPAPRPKARQLPTSIPPSSPRLSLDEVPEGTPPPSPRPRPKELSKSFAEMFEGTPLSESLKKMTKGTAPTSPRPRSKESSKSFAKMIQGTRLSESLKKTEGIPPRSPRPRSKALSQKIENVIEGTPLSSPIPRLMELLKPTSEGPSPTSPRPRPKKLSKKMNATAQSYLKSPVSDSLPLWRPQTGLPEEAGKEWMGLTPEKALEYAKEEAFSQRKSLAFYLEERRAVRTRIRVEINNANLDLSDHSFFQSSNGSGSSGSTSTVTLNKLFDRYRDNATQEPDKIGIEGSMRYLMDLGVKLDEVVVLAVLTELSAPTMGEFTRAGFVSGWQNHRAETLPKQQGQIASFRRSLAMTPDFFKRVYKQTFIIARIPGQKFVPLETALEYWRLLFTPPSLSWNTASTPWLTWWLAYLDTKWKKSISKDMWDQTGVFAMKSLEDESMSWWSEDGAWPGVLDEFVFYVREKRGNATGGTEGEMDVG